MVTFCHWREREEPYRGRSLLRWEEDKEIGGSDVVMTFI